MFLNILLNIYDSFLLWSFSVLTQVISQAIWLRRGKPQNIYVRQKTIWNLTFILCSLSPSAPCVLNNPTFSPIHSSEEMLLGVWKDQKTFTFRTCLIFAPLARGSARFPIHSGHRRASNIHINLDYVDFVLFWQHVIWCVLFNHTIEGHFSLSYSLTIFQLQNIWSRS